MSLPLPHVLAGRYVLRRRLGFGTSAVTYRAVDRYTGQAVAVKVLHEHLAADREIAARFQHEAETAAGFHHRSVVTVLDHGRDDDLLFTVMELVEGGNLKDLVRGRAPLSLPEALALIQGVLQGLEVIHQHQVIHRDVKPENILLARDGTLKLSDFGIARATDAHHLTRTGLTLGTAAYMAPEQALGEPVGPATDLYAAGIVLFQLLTGQLPFPGDDPLQVMYRQVHDAPPAPRSLNPAIPETLNAIILHALDKDPANRFASAREMWRALAQAWSDAPYPATAGTTDTLAVRPFSAAGNLRQQPSWRRLPVGRFTAGLTTAAAVLLIATLGVTGLTRGLSTTAADASPSLTATATAGPSVTLARPQATATSPAAMAADSAELPAPAAAAAPSTGLGSRPVNPKETPAAVREEPAQTPSPVPSDTAAAQPPDPGVDHAAAEISSPKPKPAHQEPGKRTPNDPAPKSKAKGKAKAEATASHGAPAMAADRSSGQHHGTERN